MNTQTPVLIVGAGPTGLTVANTLAQRGIDFRIIERDAEPIKQSRALWVHARTLEYWSRLGVLDKAIAQGRVTDRIVMLVDGKPRGSLPYRGDGISPHPYGLVLEQSKTQRILLEHLSAHGGAVTWGTELTGLSQDSVGVTATLRRGDGREEQVRASYLVAADGARSPVRHMLGLSFEGDTFPQSFFLADVEMEWGHGHDDIHLSLAHAGAFAFFPMQESRQFRLIGNVPAEMKNQTAIEAHAIEALVNRNSRVKVRILRANWSTIFHSNRRIAGSYQVGRCFLIGDAAHIHTPAGGQGMNLGIGDAYNLGWKLGEVLGGTARPELIDSYAAERRPVAQAVIQRSDRLFDLQAGTNPVMQQVRPWLLPAMAALISRAAWAQRLVFDFLAQTWVTYRDSPAVREEGAGGRRGRAARAGDRAPFARLAAGGTVYDLLTGLDHQVLVCTGAGAGHDNDVRARVQRVLEHYNLTASVIALGPDEVELYQRYAIKEPTVIFLRPDGHIGFRGPGAQPEAFAAYLDRYYTRRDTGTTPAATGRREILGYTEVA